MNSLDTSPTQQAVKPSLDNFNILLSRSWAVVKAKSGILLILAVIMSASALPTGYTRSITTTEGANNQIKTSTKITFDNQTSPIQYSTQTQNNQVSHTLAYPAWLEAVTPQHSFERLVAISHKKVGWSDFQAVLPAIGLFIAFGLLSWLISSAVKLITLDQVSQNRTSADWLTSLSWSRLARYIWTTLLSTIVITLGLICLVVPGIIIAIWFSQASYVFINENISGVEALKKSREYVRGYWWQTLGRALLGVIVIAIITGLIASIIGALIVSSGPAAMTLSIVSGLGLGIISGLGSLSSQAYLYQLYTSLKQVKTI